MVVALRDVCLTLPSIAQVFYIAKCALAFAAESARVRRVRRQVRAHGWLTFWLTLWPAFRLT